MRLRIDLSNGDPLTWDDLPDADLADLVDTLTEHRDVPTFIQFTMDERVVLLNTAHIMVVEWDA